MTDWKDARWFTRFAAGRPQIPTQFAADDPPAKPLVGIEVSGSDSGRDITRGYLEGYQLQPNDDQILALKGHGSLELYEQMAADHQVKIALEQRQRAMISREWYVEDGADDAQSKKAAEFCKKLLGSIAWDDITQKMLMGVWYGYAAAECMWARDGAQIVLDDIRVRRTRRFAFAPGGELRLLTSTDPMGEPLPPRKFWHFRVGADDHDEPYGRGLAYWAYWPWWFRRNVDKFWLVFLEKFAMPTPVGKHPPGASKDEINKLLAAARALHRDSAVAISDNTMLELLEASRNSGGDYDVFALRMNDAITRLIIGQSFTVDGAGGQYKGDVLADVKQEIVKADSDVINWSFCRQVVRWLCDWNFPGATLPRIWRRIEGQPDLKDVSETMRNIYQIGYRPTLDEIAEQFGGEWEPVETATPTPVADGAPADATQQDGADPADDPENDAADGEAEDAEMAAPPDGQPLSDDADRAAAQLGPLAEPLIESGLLAPIRAALDKAIAEGATLADFQSRLGGLFNQMDARDLAELAGKAMFCAELGGRFDVREEGKDD